MLYQDSRYQLSVSATPEESERILLDCEKLAGQFTAKIGTLAELLDPLTVKNCFPDLTISEAPTGNSRFLFDGSLESVLNLTGLAFEDQLQAYSSYTQDLNSLVPVEAAVETPEIMNVFSFDPIAIDNMLKLGQNLAGCNLGADTICREYIRELRSSRIDLADTFSQYKAKLDELGSSRFLDLQKSFVNLNLACNLRFERLLETSCLDGKLDMDSWIKPKRTISAALGKILA